MIILDFDIEKELKNKVTDFLKTLHNRTELLWLKENADSIITEELSRREHKLYTSLKFKYDVHRNEIKLVDLIAENYFPCNFWNIGYVFSYSNYLMDPDRTYYLSPILLPTDKNVFIRLWNRTLSDDERKIFKPYLENILQWYDEVQVEVNPPYGVNRSEYSNKLFDLTKKTIYNYLEPITIKGSGDLENFKPKELWVGIVNGKFHFATKQTPRFIKMWKNIRDFTLI